MRAVPRVLTVLAVAATLLLLALPSATAGACCLPAAIVFCATGGLALAWPRSRAVVHCQQCFQSACLQPACGFEPATTQTCRRWWRSAETATESSASATRRVDSPTRLF